MELLLIINKGSNFYNNINSDNYNSLYEIINSILKKYEISNENDTHSYSYYIKIDDTTNLSILDNIITEIEEEFQLYINTNKFNI